MRASARRAATRPPQYFERTECVAGVQDARFQQLMPDAVHWLGLKRIDRFVSMSDMKHDALTAQGVEIVERVPIPDELVPADAHVEIEAKKAAGYYSPEPQKPQDLTDAVGRDLDKVLRRSPVTVREVRNGRCVFSFERPGGPRTRAPDARRSGLTDKLPNFHVDLRPAGRSGRPRGADHTSKSYPSLDVPFHSRWRHFVFQRRWIAGL